MICFYIVADGSDKSTIIFVFGDVRTFCTNLMESTRQREKQVCDFESFFIRTQAAAAYCFANNRFDVVCCTEGISNVISNL